MHSLNVTNFALLHDRETPNVVLGIMSVLPLFVVLAKPSVDFKKTKRKETSRYLWPRVTEAISRAT